MPLHRLTPAIAERQRLAARPGHARHRDFFLRLDGTHFPARRRAPEKIPVLAENPDFSSALETAPERPGSRRTVLPARQNAAGTIRGMVNDAPAIHAEIPTQFQKRPHTRIPAYVLKMTKKQIDQRISYFAHPDRGYELRKFALTRYFSPNEQHNALRHPETPGEWLELYYIYRRVRKHERWRARVKRVLKTDTSEEGKKAWDAFKRRPPVPSKYTLETATERAVWFAINEFKMTYRAVFENREINHAACAKLRDAEGNELAEHARDNLLRELASIYRYITETQKMFWPEFLENALRAGGSRAALRALKRIKIESRLLPAPKKPFDGQPFYPRLALYIAHDFDTTERGARRTSVPDAFHGPPGARQIRLRAPEMSAIFRATRHRIRWSALKADAITAHGFHPALWNTPLGHRLAAALNQLDAGLPAPADDQLYRSRDQARLAKRMLDGMLASQPDPHRLALYTRMTTAAAARANRPHDRRRKDGQPRKKWTRRTITTITE